MGNGFLYAATSLNASGASGAYTLGMVFWAVYVVYTAYMLLSYPGGRLEATLERVFIRAYALSTAVLWSLILALSPTFPGAGSFNDCGTRCPPNALAAGDAATGTALNTAASIVFTIGLIGLTMLLFDKARAPGPVVRRALGPVTAVFAATVAWFVISLYVLPAYPETASVVTIVNGVLGLAIPTAILVGLVWGDLAAARSVGQIALRASGKPLTAAGVQAVIGEALGDSTTALALWAPERAGYVDVDGAPLELPRDPRVRGVTHITNGDGPVAALIHHPRLDTDSDAFEGLAATSLMLVENIRLVDELRASRLRIVEAGEHERRRLENELHDSAQNRLVALQIRLSMAQERTGDDILGELAEEAVAVGEDLRRIAHGLSPPMLATQGLTAALTAEGSRSAIPVEVVAGDIGLSEPHVERAVYLCCLESIQNAAKHGGDGTSATVRLRREDGELRFSVADDGRGFDPCAVRPGAGLANLRERVDTAGGRVEIRSAPGRGTTITGTVPWPARTAPGTA